MKGTATVLLSSVLLTTPFSGAQAQSVSAGNIARPETRLSKTVVRITGKIQGEPLAHEGTGFIVGVPDSRLPGKLFTYLVTNRHIAEAIFPDPEGRYASHTVLEMKAILNLKQPVEGTRAHAIPLPPEGIGRWYFPEDKSIDLAVISIPADDSTYDVAYLTPSLFLTSDLWDKFLVVPGDKVLTCGFFLHYGGKHQFQPIIREGSLAMVPDDVMPVPIGGNAKVYLADLHIIPGNSGSPLFLAPSFTDGGYIMGPNGEIPYYLLGIISGYMWEDSQLTLRPATDYEGTVHANSGIATVVPIEQLKDLLYSSELQRRRDSAVANSNRAGP
jgi:hypothetical protein